MKRKTKSKNDGDRGVTAKVDPKSPEIPTSHYGGRPI